MKEMLHPGQTATANESLLVTAGEQERHPGAAPMLVVAAARGGVKTPQATGGEPMTPEKTSHLLTLVAARRQSAPAPEKESTARAALELLTGHTLSDLEWDRMRARLLEFVSILRDWGQEITTAESELPKAA